MAYKRMSRNDAYMNVANVEDDEDVIDLLEVARAILKHIKLIILLCVVFGAAGFFGTKYLIAPKYTASTSIYLTPQINDTGSLDYNSQMANSKLVTNVVNLMTQNNVMSEDTFIKTMQKNLNVRNIEIVDKAKLSYVPSGPNAKKNGVLAAAVGFVLGAGYAILRYLLDNRLRNKEEAEKYLGIPVFCEFPEV